MNTPTNLDKVSLGFLKDVLCWTAEHLSGTTFLYVEDIPDALMTKVKNLVVNTLEHL